MLGAYVQSSPKYANDLPEHSRAAGWVGLGFRIDVIPVGNPPVPANQHDIPRHVWLTWHPVAGVIGQAFQLMKTDSASSATQHWTIRVGDYEHELNADEQLNVVYQNKRNADLPPTQMRDLKVETTFNDRAIVEAADRVIGEMAGKYHLFDNNCQLFADKLAKAICPGQNINFPPTAHDTPFWVLTRTYPGVLLGPPI